MSPEFEEKLLALGSGVSTMHLSPNGRLNAPADHSP